MEAMQCRVRPRPDLQRGRHFRLGGGPGDAVWMRGYKPPPCWPTRGGDEVKAAIFYENADTTKAPNTTAGPNAYQQGCKNDPLSQTVPVMKLKPGEPTSSEVIPLDFRSNGTNLLWYMANRTFRVDYNDPVLLEAKLGNLNFPDIRNVHNYGTNKSIRFIVENPGPQPHPMHVHGMLLCSKLRMADTDVSRTQHVHPG